MLGGEGASFLRKGVLQGRGIERNFVFLVKKRSIQRFDKVFIFPRGRERPAALVISDMSIGKDM